MSKDKLVRLEYRYDEDCEMESLFVNGKSINTGNAWDYHLSDGFDTVKDVLTVLNIPFEAKITRATYTNSGQWRNIRPVEEK